MTNLTVKQLTEYSFTGSFDVACSFKPDEDSPENMRKRITLEVGFKDISLSDMAYAAAKKAVVPFQNGRGRKHYSDYKNGQRVKVEFTRPASAPVIDPEVAMVARLQAMEDPKDREKYIVELLTKATSETLELDPVKIIKGN